MTLDTLSPVAGRHPGREAPTGVLIRSVVWELRRSLAALVRFTEGDRIALLRGILALPSFSNADGAAGVDPAPAPAVPAPEERPPNAGPLHPAPSPHTTPDPGMLPEGPPSGCRNHPGVPAPQNCTTCRNRFCDQCLVEFGGSLLCAWCKQMALAQLHAPPPQTINPNAVVAWARFFDIAMAVSAVASLALRFYLMGMMDSVGAPGAGRGASLTAMGALVTVSLAPAVLALLASLPPAFGLGSGRRWAYWWQVVMLIPAALLSCLWASCVGFIFWPAAVALLIFLVKPEVKHHCTGN